MTTTLSGILPIPFANPSLGQTSHAEHVERLKTELAKRREKNRAYSLRAFAKHLGLDAGSLSRILNRKQDLSLRSAILISQRLAFSPEETRQFLGSVADQKIREIADSLAMRREVSKETLASLF